LGRISAKRARQHECQENQGGKAEEVHYRMIPDKP
jgi:hypothetical protein